MLKNPWEHRDFWFALHKYLQMFAVLTALVGFIIPFCVSGSRGLGTTHGQLGLAVMIMFFFQPFIGFFRPDRGTQARSLWFSAHWCVGISCVVLGWLNTIFGLDLYASEFNTGLQVRLRASSHTYLLLCGDPGAVGPQCVRCCLVHCLLRQSQLNTRSVQDKIHHFASWVGPEGFSQTLCHRLVSTAVTQSPAHVLLFEALKA